MSFAHQIEAASRQQPSRFGKAEDDPGFPVPLYASLVEAHEGYVLIWSRSRAAD